MGAKVLTHGRETGHVGEPTPTWSTLEGPLGHRNIESVSMESITPIVCMDSKWSLSIYLTELVLHSRELGKQSLFSVRHDLNEIPGYIVTKVNAWSRREPTCGDIVAHLQAA